MSICPKCSSAAKPINESYAGEYEPQEAYRCTLCGHEFVVYYGAAVMWLARHGAKK
jgi:transposase-like protein